MVSVLSSDPSSPSPPSFLILNCNLNVDFIKRAEVEDATECKIE